MPKAQFNIVMSICVHSTSAHRQGNSQGNPYPLHPRFVLTNLGKGRIINFFITYEASEFDDRHHLTKSLTSKDRPVVDTVTPP